MACAHGSEKSIFLEALEIEAPAERVRFLDRVCGGQPQLRSSVEALLRAHEQPHALLDPAMARVTECTGTMIGAYKLLEVIGEGGFGVVFMAEQQVPVRRKVALKVLKPGMDTRQVVARFEAERQALALMDHPHIAKVFDGGEAASGRPYFAMELVRGAPITNFCDQNRLSIRARLELFCKVCEAVQHAHQKGVIHRDLKPSNIMVTLHDGKPVVKVIDFGIAKAIGQQLTDKTLFTNFTQMMGTPIYMSPEQAEMSGLDVDTRTDIYSLGVLLYELLTGTTPFEKERLKTASYDEIRRIIREDEPPRPSTRVSTLGQATTELSASRQSDPERLRRLFRGELDWIVMKVLEKDRNRRYESAGTLAADIQRYLHDEAVQACPPSAAYWFQKFARRNKIVLTTGTVVLAALILGTLISAWQAIRAKQAERQAGVSLAAEKQVRKEAESNLLKARQVVDQYLTLTSESRLLDVPGLQPLRKELLEAALAYYEDFLKQRPTDPELQAELAAAFIRVSQIYTAINSDNQAMAALNQGVKLVEKLRAAYPKTTDWQLRLAGTYNVGRDLHYGNEAPAAANAARDLLTTTIRIWEQFAAEHRDVAGFRSDLAAFYSFRADLEMDSSRRDAAVHDYRKARDLWETLAREFPAAPDYRAALSRSLDGMGKAMQRLHQQPEAETLYGQSLAIREALASEFPDRPEYRIEVAYAELRLARLLPPERAAEANTKLRLAQSLLVKAVAESPNVPSLRENLGITYYDLARLQRRMGQPDEAILSCCESLAIYERLGADYPALHQYRERWASHCRDLAVMLLDANRPEEAERCYAQAVEVMERLVAQAPRQIIYRRRLAESYIGQGYLLWATARHAEAAAAYRRAIELREGIAAESPNVPLYVRELVRLLAICPVRDLCDNRRILEVANQAVQLAPNESVSWYTLGLAHYAAGDWPAALAALERSSGMIAGVDSSDPLDPALWFVRAMTLWQLSRSATLTDEERARYQAEARDRNARAIEWMKTINPINDDLRHLRVEAAELMMENAGSKR
jgi:eukaryotic-like serine/threonine-protein kinase